MIITDEETQEVLLYNGLYKTSENLLDSLHDQRITAEEYVTASKKLFETWERLKEQKND